MGIKRLYFEKILADKDTPESLVLPINEIQGRDIIIQAKPANISSIIVGDSVSILTGVGHSLDPGDYITIRYDSYIGKDYLHASDIWLKAAINGDGVVASYPYSDDKIGLND